MHRPSAYPNGIALYGHTYAYGETSSLTSLDALTYYPELLQVAERHPHSLAEALRSWLLTNSQLDQLASSRVVRTFFGLRELAQTGASVPVAVRPGHTPGSGKRDPGRVRAAGFTTAPLRTGRRIVMDAHRRNGPRPARSSVPSSPPSRRIRTLCVRGASSASSRPVPCVRRMCSGSTPWSTYWWSKTVPETNGPENGSHSHNLPQPCIVCASASVLHNRQLTGLRQRTLRPARSPCLSEQAPGQRLRAWCAQPADQLEMVREIPADNGGVAADPSKSGRLFRVRGDLCTRSVQAVMCTIGTDSRHRGACAQALAGADARPGGGLPF